MLHAPKQSRSRRTLGRILAAARHLMAAEGVTAVGITQIAREARSSVGSFYARFDGKDDLVRFLHDRLWAEATERWEQGGETWDAGAVMEIQVAKIVSLIRTAVVENFRLRTALTHELGVVGAQAQNAFDTRVAEDSLALLRDGEGLRHPEPQSAVDTGIRIVLASYREHLSAIEPNWPSLPEDDRGTHVDALTFELDRVLRGFWGVGRLVQVENVSEPRIEYFDIWN